MANDTLNVFHGERRVGRLTHDGTQQIYSFRYDEGWQSDAAGYDLAPLLPRKELVHSGSVVRFFFSNLLPEGEMLEIVSRTHGVSRYDPFGLLRKIGAECAGSLKILESDKSFPDGKTYRRVAAEELSARAKADAPDVLANLGGKPRMSLAGVQDKLPALVAEDGTIAVPDAGSASTHILKPNHRQWRTFPHTAVNEHFCMQLARRVGIDAPRTMLLRVPEALYAVKRFDRVFMPPLAVEARGDQLELRGEPVRRLHQIDVCQLLGLPPTQKYEEPEFDTPPGPDIATVVEALSDTIGDALSVKRGIIDWVVFNYLTGNSDSHSKNISLLWRDGRWALAPAYDLLSVAVYSGDPEKLHDFAFNIGGETRYGWVAGSNWFDFARSLGVNYRYVQSTLLRLSNRLTAEADALLRELAPAISSEERELLDRIAALIRTHAGFASESSRTIVDAARAARTRPAVQR